MSRTKTREKGMTFDLPLEPAGGDKIASGEPKAHDMKKVETGKEKATKAKVEKKTEKTALSVVKPGAKLPAPKTMAEALMQASLDPRVDPVKLQQLYQINKMIADEEARREFTVAYMALQRDMRGIVIQRDGKITIPAKDGKAAQNTAYATFENIMTTMAPLLEKHGFSVSFANEPASDPGRLICRGFLDHEGGHQRTTAFPLPIENSGSKNNVQGWGSTQSYGKRYCFIALVNVISYAPGDKDIDGNDPGKQIERKVKKGEQDKRAEEATVIQGEIVQGGGEPEVKKIDAQQLNILLEWIDDCGIGQTKFCTHYEIKKVEDLPAARHAEAVKACKDYKANRAAK